MSVPVWSFLRPFTAFAPRLIRMVTLMVALPAFGHAATFVREGMQALGKVSNGDSPWRFAQQIIEARGGGTPADVLRLALEIKEKYADRFIPDGTFTWQDVPSVLARLTHNAPEYFMPKPGSFPEFIIPRRIVQEVGWQEWALNLFHRVPTEFWISAALVVGVAVLFWALNRWKPALFRSSAVNGSVAALFAVSPLLRLLQWGQENVFDLRFAFNAATTWTALAGSIVMMAFVLRTLRAWRPTPEESLSDARLARGFAQAIPYAAPSQRPPLKMLAHEFDLILAWSVRLREQAGRFASWTSRPYRIHTVTPVDGSAPLDSWKPWVQGLWQLVKAPVILLIASFRAMSRLIHFAAVQPVLLSRLIRRQVLRPWRRSPESYGRLDAEWKALSNRLYASQSEMLAELNAFQARFQADWQAVGSPENYEWESLRYVSLKTAERLSLTMSATPAASTLTRVDYPDKTTKLLRLIPLEYGYRPESLTRLAERPAPRAAGLLVRSLDAYAFAYRAWRHWRPEVGLPDLAQLPRSFGFFKNQRALRGTISLVLAFFLMTESLSSESIDLTPPEAVHDDVAPRLLRHAA
jgi:hypothetical protein